MYKQGLFIKDERSQMDEMSFKKSNLTKCAILKDHREMKMVTVSGCEP